MTNEEAKVFLDNLKICIEEHPIIADWLIEIADRKTEPSAQEYEKWLFKEPSRAEQTEPSRGNFNKATLTIKNGVGIVEPIYTEPSTDCSWKKGE